MELDIYNQKKEKIGVLEVPDGVFNAKWNPELVRQVVDAYRANARQTSAHTKDRSEVRGGGKKPWRQKHTGRARHGSSRSPLWAGGGVTFGPRNERNFKKKVNKKMKRGAFSAVLSEKLRARELFVIDNLRFRELKTKYVAEFLRLFLESGKRQQSVVLVPGKNNRELFRIARNIPRCAVIDAGTLNAYDCLAKKFILLEKEAVEDIVKRY